MPVARLVTAGLVTLGALVLPSTASAQLTSCAVTGEYVLTGTCLVGPPAQLGGTATFTPR